MKRALALLLICTFLFGTNVFAAGIDFDVTVNKDKINEDNYSRKITKNGGSKYENRFYVTAKQFIIRDTIQCYSLQEDDRTMTSYPRTLKPGMEYETKSNPYVGNAPANKIYRMHSYFGGSVGSCRLKGTFCP